MNYQPYVQVNTALSQPFSIGLFPIMLIGPFVLCLFFAYLTTQLFWAALFGRPSFIWTIGVFFWLATTYYVVVGDQPWRIKNQISYIPRYRRGMYPAKSLLNENA